MTRYGIVRPAFGRLAGLTLLMVFFLYGCMGGRTLTVDLKYEPAKDPASPFAEAGKLKVALVPFESASGVNDTFGKWVGLRGKEDMLKSSTPVDEAVTQAVFDYLKRAGFDVVTAPRGASLIDYKTVPPDLAIGGTIESLKTEAVSYFGVTKIKSELRLKVAVKNVKDSSVLNVNIEGSSEPRTVVTFDSGAFKETVNGVLSESVEKIFANTVLKNGLVRPGT